MLLREAESSRLCLCTVTSPRCFDIMIDTTHLDQEAHLNVKLI